MAPRSCRTGGVAEAPRSEASIALTYFGPNNFERAGAGSKSFDNNALGVGSETSGGSTTYYRRDSGGGLHSERLPSGSAYYYVFDGLGSVRAVTDSSGTAQDTYSYEPYGATASSTAPVANPWQFASGYHDSNGWYKFEMRYMSGRVMRWSQVDPKEQPTDPVQQDRFAYAGDDPINRTDPSGECVIVDCSVYHTIGKWGESASYIPYYAGHQAMSATHDALALTPFGPPVLAAETLGLAGDAGFDTLEGSPTNDEGITKPVPLFGPTYLPGIHQDGSVDFP
jgi:RHS repeat-associated protein